MQRSKTSSWSAGASNRDIARAILAVYNFIETAYLSHFTETSGFDKDYRACLGCAHGRLERGNKRELKGSYYHFQLPNPSTFRIQYFCGDFLLELGYDLGIFSKGD